jgi:phage terminase small subunit
MERNPVDIVPDKPIKSRKGAGGNHRKNSPAVKAFEAQKKAEAIPQEVEADDKPSGVATPKRPIWLTDPIALIVWDDLMPELIANGRIATVDASLIAVYCQDLAIYMRSAEKQRRLEESTTENRQKLLLDQADKAQKRLLLMAEHLGIGTKSRAVVGKATAPNVVSVNKPLIKTDEELEKERKRAWILGQTG